MKIITVKELAWLGHVADLVSASRKFYFPRRMTLNKLKPYFELHQEKSSYLLSDSAAELLLENDSFLGEGEIHLDLLPNASIHAYCTFKNVPSKHILECCTGSMKMSLKIKNQIIEGFCLDTESNLGSGELKIKWCPSFEKVRGDGEDSTRVAQVFFHLFNFVDFHGTGHSIEKTDSSQHAIEHLYLSYNDWEIELKSLISTKKSFERLKKEGGYRLTHIGQICKKNGCDFTAKEAESILTSLRLFFSFAKGSWCPPVIPIGLDKSGSQVWSEWIPPRDPWVETKSWFDSHNSGQLATLFPLFMEKIANEEWKEAFQDVIYWYLNANLSSRGIDAGIILTQSAIERLSYEFAVKERILLTPKGFKDLWASDKFRLLFSSLNVPIRIPDSTSELVRLAKLFKWEDAPQALTEVRNSLVHPEHKKRGLLDAAYFEAWNLGLWFLEMGILAICGFSDTYGNRLKQKWVGQVENVPWQNSSPF